MANGNSRKPLPRAFAFAAVALLAICALGGMMASDTDGVVVSSSFDMGTAYKGEYFSSTKTQALYDFGENMEPTGISVSGSTTQYGLTVSVSQEDAGSYAPEVTVSVSGTPDRKSTRLNPVTAIDLVCRLLLEKKKKEKKEVKRRRE